MELPLNPRGTNSLSGFRPGVGDTAEQGGSFPDVAAEIVAGYRADVLKSAQPVVRGLSEADLETTNPDRPPPSATGWVLARIPVECFHIGQVAYIRGPMPDQEDRRRWLLSLWVRRDMSPPCERLLTEKLNGQIRLIQKKWSVSEAGCF